MCDCEEEEDMILMIDWRRLCEEGERMMIDLGRHNTNKETSSGRG